jgi:hypothetical protein
MTCLCTVWVGVFSELWCICGLTLLCSLRKGQLLFAMACL